MENTYTGAPDEVPETDSVCTLSYNDGLAVRIYANSIAAHEAAKILGLSKYTVLEWHRVSSREFEIREDTKPYPVMTYKQFTD